jgi:hypothetical protein
VFQHFLWYNLQPSTDALHAASGHGWDLEKDPTGGHFALHEAAANGNPAALDAITFPNLRPDVHVGLASVVVAAIQPARVTFVGANGVYTVAVPAHATQTAVAGESSVLQGTPRNPTLELGPIREIILDSQSAYFYNLKALVIPSSGPLDDFVTAAPGTSTPIDVLDFATGGAAAAGLQEPLELVAPPGQPSLPGGQTAISATNPSDIVYTNTVVAQPGQHPTDSFTYTVKDANGRTATGTVYVTIDTPPVVHITMDPPAMADGPGWVVPWNTPGPLTGQISLSDAENDPVRLAVSDWPQHGTLKLTKVSDVQYSFSYVPLTTDIAFDDRFTVRVSDLSSGQNVYTSTDYAVAFRVGGRLQDSVLAAPGTSTAIDVLDYATGEAYLLGLQVPLELVAPSGQPSLPGSQTAISTTNPNDIVYTNTVTPQPGQHPTDSFTYTVQDANLKTITGTVSITIDAPPVFDVKVNKPAMEEADGWAFPHGTPGPLTGMIDITDAEDEPLTLVVAAEPLHGTLNLTKVSDNQYSFSYVPPTTYAYDFHEGESDGVSSAVSVINGDDQFTLRAFDTYSSTDYTVPFVTPADYDPPQTAAISPSKMPVPSEFVVPENVGVSYYPDQMHPGYQYNPSLDFPGLVHFAAPGVLWNQTDFAGRVPGPSGAMIPQFDPLRADLATPPQHGLLDLLPDGSFNYTPEKGWTGKDTFAFYASDGYMTSKLIPVVIHVVPGTASHPFENAPVNLDIHYRLDTPGSVRFTPPVSYNSQADFFHFSPGFSYPATKILIRPVLPTGGLEGAAIQIGVNNITRTAFLDLFDRRFRAGYGFLNDLSLYYDSLGERLFLSSSDISTFVDEGSEPRLDLDPILQDGGPVDVSMTYATANANGWLSNFASIVVRVIPWRLR